MGHPSPSHRHNTPKKRNGEKGNIMQGVFGLLGVAAACNVLAILGVVELLVRQSIGKMTAACALGCVSILYAVCIMLIVSPRF